MYTQNLLSILLKARHLGGSAFCDFYRLEVPERVLGGIPLGFGIVVKINLLNLHAVTWTDLHVGLV